MQIVCPHCSTSYGISPASLGEAGRTVRCARCKEVWLARPEDALEFANHPMAEANGADAAANQTTAPTNRAMGKAAPRMSTVLR